MQESDKIFFDAPKYAPPVEVEQFFGIYNQRPTVGKDDPSYWEWFKNISGWVQQQDGEFLGRFGAHIIGLADLPRSSVEHILTITGYENLAVNELAIQRKEDPSDQVFDELVRHGNSEHIIRNEAVAITPRRVEVLLTERPPLQVVQNTTEVEQKRLYDEENFHIVKSLIESRRSKLTLEVLRFMLMGENIMKKLFNERRMIDIARHIALYQGRILMGDFIINNKEENLFTAIQKITKLSEEHILLLCAVDPEVFKNYSKTANFTGSSIPAGARYPESGF
jgi:hypothetical protein